MRMAHAQIGKHTMPKRHAYPAAIALCLALASAAHTAGPLVTLTEAPKSTQVVPRPLPAGNATIPVVGTVNSNGYDDVVLRLTRESAAYLSVTQTLVYAGDTAPFAFSPSIVPELANYDFELAVRQGASETPVAVADDVVAGDIHIIQGQSNADANMFNGSANGNQHAFLRTFGMNSDSAATTTANQDWLMATGDGSRNKAGGVGQWGLRMGRLLVDTYGIPIAILNGAHGGKPIDFFQRNDTNHEDLSNNYGRLLYRARLANVTNDVRAVLWYQGESDGGAGATHENGFIALYQDWKENYPSIERVYIQQLRVGCGVTKDNVDLRDRQRRLPDTFADMSVMSTTGLNGHDGCHYAYATGYKLLGERTFALVARDLYGAPDLPNIEAPNISHAMFANAAATEVVIFTRNGTDELIFDSGAEADWILNGTAVTVTSGSASDNRISLTLSGSAAAATGITYTGHTGSGPWVTNSAGVGLLTFSAVPIAVSTNPPTTPTGLTGQALGSGSAALAWDTNTNAASFNVRRDGVVIAGTATLTYTDIGLNEQSTYDYAVAAVNPYGTSTWSSVVSVTTLQATAAPATPLGLQALALSSNSVRLTWQSVSNAEWYAVQRDGAFVDTYMGTNVVDTGLTPASAYTYAVAAANGGGTSAWSSAVVVTTRTGSVYEDVPEAADYVLIYSLDIPNGASFSGGNAIPYSTDNSRQPMPYGFDRVAYYMVLDSEWVFVSMDDFSHGSLRGIGIPHSSLNPVAHQGIIRNMNVYASPGSGIATGTAVQTGNIEMWPGNYSAALDVGIPGASGSAYDFGDRNTAGTSSGYGSFQVHNYGAVLAGGGQTGQVIFAYNRWGSNNGNDELGIGNSPSGHPDYTFEQNAASYTAKRLQIFVRPRAGDPSHQAMRLAEDVRGKVAEAADYNLLCDVDIPAGPLKLNGEQIPYNLDLSHTMMSSIARVAYYMQLGTNWVFASMDPFTPDPRRLGIPSRGPAGNGGTVFQQLVANMNVYASTGAGVTTGTDIQTGNIEFWSRNYGGDNGIGIPNATNVFDFGDAVNGSVYTHHGSMQIHNHDIDGGDPGTVGETLMAFNRWGKTPSGQSSLGIGTSPSGQPDWTFNENADTYTTRRIQVFAQPRVFANVPEAADYDIIYGLEIPNAGSFQGATSVPYAINRSTVPLPYGYDRVAYYFELDDGNGLEWVFVSMDDFVTQDLKRLALPHNVDNPVVHQRIVANMDVYASAGANVATGTNIQTGNIEIWPSNYDGVNTIGIPNASDVAQQRDFGDHCAGGAGTGYGSFQVCNHDLDGTGPGTTGEVIFAYNRWGSNNGTDEVGIGNDTNSARVNWNPDWTFAQNAAGYTIKNLQILVRPRTEDLGDALDALHANVPESETYELVYDLPIPTGAAYNSQHVPYMIDRSGIIPYSFGRIAYYLELDNEWVYASMDAFTQDPGQIGVPSRGPNGNGSVVFQQPVSNMNVYASPTAGVTMGNGIQSGNIEFWSYNYSPTIKLGLPGADGGKYDFDDTHTGSQNYGSMQVHNHDIDGAGPGTAGETLFAYNSWGANAGGSSALGIGNNTEQAPNGQTHPDWTFMANTGTYGNRHLQVLVQPRVYANVPAARDYRVIYALEIPRSGKTDFHSQGIPYVIDRAEELNGLDFARVAYYLELKKPGEAMNWVFVSFDAFTRDLAKIGVPNADVGRAWQQNVDRMDVFASPGAGVGTGRGIPTGSIEFWPNSYGPANEAGVPGASASTYDFGDGVTADVPEGHGSMQVHNHGAGEVVLAYNAWGSRERTGELGIGSQAGDNPDWTLNDNAGDYEIANLFVLVSPPREGTVLLVR